MKNKCVHFQTHQKLWKHLIRIYIRLTCACLLHKIVWVDFEFFVCFLRWFFKWPFLLWFSGVIPIINHYRGSWYTKYKCVIWNQNPDFLLEAIKWWVPAFKIRWFQLKPFCSKCHKCSPTTPLFIRAAMNASF